MTTTRSPREGYPQICPYLYYRDANAAVDFLVNAFGFHERSAFRSPEGQVIHAELETGSGVVFVGPGMEFFGTAAVEDPDHVHAGLYVYVDDLNGHLEHARKRGAKIRSEIEEKPHGDLMYTAADPEGQRWYFAQPK